MPYLGVFGLVKVFLGGKRSDVFSYYTFQNQLGTGRFWIPTTSS
jgi:hypothetical protein